jgi:hypothetical protein
MKKITESGVHSISFRNALAYAKRRAVKETYSFVELVEDAKIEYILTTEETDALREKLVSFCRKNYLYVTDIQRMEEFGYI